MIADYIFETAREILYEILRAYPEYIDEKVDVPENEVVLSNIEIKLDLESFKVEEAYKIEDKEIYVPVQIGEHSGYANQKFFEEPPIVWALFLNNEYFNVAFDTIEEAQRFQQNSWREMIEEGLINE
jgi:hypothetical protein